MDIIAGLGLIASPFIITGLTSLIKKLADMKLHLGSTQRVLILRTVVTVLSFIAVIVTSLINGTEVDSSVISQFADAIVLAIGATGVYYWNKYKNR